MKSIEQSKELLALGITLGTLRSTRELSKVFEVIYEGKLHLAEIFRKSDLYLKHQTSSWIVQTCRAILSLNEESRSRLGVREVKNTCGFLVIFRSENAVSIGQWLENQGKSSKAKWALASDLWGAISTLKQQGIMLSALPLDRISIEDKQVVLDIAEYLIPEEKESRDLMHTELSKVYQTIPVGYVPPEFFLESRFGPQTLVWIFGNIFFRLLEGKEPYSFRNLYRAGEYYKQSLSKLSELQFSTIEAKPFKILFKKCLHVNPRDRICFQELSQLLKDFFVVCEIYRELDTTLSKNDQKPQTRPLHILSSGSLKKLPSEDLALKSYFISSKRTKLSHMRNSSQKIMTELVDLRKTFYPSLTQPSNHAKFKLNRISFPQKKLESLQKEAELMRRPQSSPMARTMTARWLQPSSYKINHHFLATTVGRSDTQNVLF